MAVGSDKTRISVTMPDALLAELQQEATEAKRPLSEVIVAAIREHRQGTDQRLDALKDQFTHWAGKVETELATVHQVLSKVVSTLEGLAQSREQGREMHTPEPPVKIATYEEMYGPITSAPPPAPPALPEEPKPRKRWPW